MLHRSPELYINGLGFRAGPMMPGIQPASSAAALVRVMLFWV